MILVIATMVLGLRRSLRGVVWPEADQAKALWSVPMLLVGSFVVAAATAFAGVYRPASGPTIRYGPLAPVVVGALAFLTWPLLRRIVLANILNTWLVGVQFYRAGDA